MIRVPSLPWNGTRRSASPTNPEEATAFKSQTLRRQDPWIDVACSTQLSKNYLARRGCQVPQRGTSGRQNIRSELPRSAAQALNEGDFSLSAVFNLRQRTQLCQEGSGFLFYRKQEREGARTGFVSAKAHIRAPFLDARSESHLRNAFLGNLEPKDRHSAGYGAGRGNALVKSGYSRQYFGVEYRRPPGSCHLFFDHGTALLNAFQSRCSQSSSSRTSR